MGQSIGDRLRELADRLDTAADNIKDTVRSGLNDLLLRLEDLTDKAEAGEEAEVEGGIEAPPEATQLPAEGSEEESDDDDDALRPGQLPA